MFNLNVIFTLFFIKNSQNSNENSKYLLVIFDRDKAFLIMNEPRIMYNLDYKPIKQSKEDYSSTLQEHLCSWLFAINN